MFRHTGTIIHMLAHTLVHFTCVLRRQPCKEITSALVVLLCYNTGPAAGELRVPRLPPLGPNSISSSVHLFSAHTSQILLVSYSAASLLPVAPRRDANAASAVVRCWVLV